MLNKKPSPLVVVFAAALGSMLAITQCGGNSTPAPSTTLGVASVTVNPASITAGATAQATVTLTATTGATVNLTSSNAGVATVPASVGVAAGAASATFPVTAVSPGAATITASVSGSQGSTTVTVVAATSTVQTLTLTLSASSVVGGNSVTGTVTLTPAPSANATIVLSGSDPVTVPASVTIPAGQTVAQFTVNTRATGGTIPTTVGASFNGLNASAPLSVMPNVPAESLDSITLNPSTVSGGGTSQGTATINKAAAAGGAVVTLSSNNAAASVPGSITIPAGATSGTFTVTTTAVSSATQVVISGTRDATRSATLTVNAAANAPVARFIVTGPGGADTCKLTAAGAFDCLFDGSASTASAGGTLIQWNWNYTVASSKSENLSAPTLTPSPGCGVFPTTPPPASTTQLQMIVTLQVHDTFNRDSTVTTNNNVRVVRSGLACGF